MQQVKSELVAQQDIVKQVIVSKDTEISELRDQVQMLLDQQATLHGSIQAERAELDADKAPESDALRKMIIDVEQEESDDEVAPKDFKKKITIAQKIATKFNLYSDQYEKVKQERH